MTRVEKNSGLQQTVGELKQEVIKVEKAETRGRGGWPGKRGCCVFVLLVFLVAAGAITCGLAASGLITVPVISPMVYEIPAPSHVVVAGPPLEAYISETFGSILTDRLQSGSGSLSDREVEIFLPEASITTSFRAILEDNNFGLIDAAAAQVAIDKNQGVEIFLPLAGQTNGNAARLLLTLGTKDGRAVLNDAQVKIGSLTIPFFVTDIILEPIVNQGLNYLNQEIGRYASLEKIEPLAGALEVSGTLTVEIMKIQ